MGNVGIKHAIYGFPVCKNLKKQRTAKKKKKSPITKSDAQIPSNYSSPMSTPRVTRKIFDEIFTINHCAWCLQAKSTKHNGLTDSKIDKIKQLKLWNRNL